MEGVAQDEPSIQLVNDQREHRGEVVIQGA